MPKSDPLGSTVCVCSCLCLKHPAINSIQFESITNHPHHPHHHRCPSERNKMSNKTIKPIEVLKWTTFLACFLITCLALVVIVRTLLVQKYLIDSYCSLNGNDGPKTDRTHKPITAERGIYERFQQALRFRTITKAPKKYSRNETLHFIEFLRFPLIHSSSLVQLEVINDLSLLYMVRGSNPTLKPYMLLAHMDVVPVQENMWEFPPFDGSIHDDYIYGRGALDLKSVLMSIMESLEFILENQSPIVRSFYIAFGHDEEGRGLDGAQQIAQHMLSKQMADVEFILDEGPYIFCNAIPGVSRDVAMIGVAEKGLVNIRLSTVGAVGHSSLPPKETSIVKMAKAVSKLNADSHPNLFGQGPEKDMIEALAPYASLPYRILFTNLWLFRPLVAWLLENDKLMNSFIRTTTAVTIFTSGIKDNVLPGKAEVIVNHRIYPLNKVDDVLRRDVELINDPDINVEVLGVAIQPHPISPYDRDSFGYQTVRTSIQQVFGDIAIIPGIMYAATDTRWYLNFTRNIYRFSPGYITLEQFSIVHGHNERISKENYLKMVNFYHHVIMNANDVQVDIAYFKDEF